MTGDYDPHAADRAMRNIQRMRAVIDEPDDAELREWVNLHLGSWKLWGWSKLFRETLT